MERTFKRKEKGAPLKKWSLRLGLGVVLIVLCVIYFERPEIPQQLLETTRSASVFSQNQKRLPISESRKATVAQAAKEEVTTSGQVASGTPPQGVIETAQKGHGSGPADQKQGSLPEAKKSGEAEPADQEKSKETEDIALSGKTEPKKATHPVRQPVDTNKADQTNRLQRNLALKSPSPKTAEIAPVRVSRNRSPRLQTSPPLS